MKPHVRSLWDIWREQLWSNFVRLESRSDDEQFFGRVERATEGSNRLARVCSTSQVTERTPAHIRFDPRELVLVAVQRSGYGYIEQDGRQARLDAGDFGFYDTTRPYRLYFDAPFQQLIVRLPRDLLERRLPSLGKLTARCFPGQSGAVAVASGFALQLADNAASLGDQGLESFEAVAADLLATAILYSDKGADYEDRARFERVQRRVMRHVRDPNPDFEKIAAKEGMSLRTFQRLFQTHGSTPNRWLQDRRLEGAASEMRSTHLANRSITEIAYSWGFNDMSHFNRTFRARFGGSPSQWRLG